jgi:hypothetical protein
MENLVAPSSAFAGTFPIKIDTFRTKAKPFWLPSLGSSLFSVDTLS